MTTPGRCRNMPGMTKRLGRTNRVEFRLPPDLDAEVRAECRRRGWNITEWGERACRALLSDLAAVSSDTTAALETAPSDPQGATLPEGGLASVPVPSPEEDGGRRAAQSRTPTNIMASSPDTRPAYSRANVGPKPLSATKPRPKAKAKKGER